MVNVYSGDLTRKDTLRGSLGANQGQSAVPSSRPKLKTKQDSFIGSILGPAFVGRRFSLTSEKSIDKKPG